jgi:hypothetical protein
MILAAAAAMAGASFLALGGTASAHTLADDFDDQKPKDGVMITGVTYGGTGCKDATVAASLSADYEALTLMFDEYVAEIGKDTDQSKKRRFCQILVDLDFPAGFSFSLVSLDYSGYASLDWGVRAEQKSTYYFQGFAKDERYSFKTRLLGEIDTDYDRHDELEMLAWSPCDKRRGLNIVTTLQLDNRRNKDGEGHITLDSIEGVVKEKYGLRWRKCT